MSAAAGTIAAAPAPARPPMGGALAPATGASLRLPGQHFVASILFLLAGAVGLVVVAPELTAGSFLSLRVAGVTHLFTLGWLTTTIFGALYQLLPVALGAPVRWERLGHVSFWCYAPGVALFVTGILRNSLPLHHVGIALLTTGIVLFVVNVGLTLPRATSRDVTWWAVVAGLFFLVCTLALGVALLHNLHTGFLLERRVPTLAAHMHVALVGWVLIMIVGMSHRLLPMFLLAHGADSRWTRRALVLLPAGLPLFAAGMLHGVPHTAAAGVAVLEAGLACYLIQAGAFARARKRPRLDAGLRFAFLALAFLLAGALLAPALFVLGGVRHPRLATVYVLLVLVGGATLFVTGFFYKIVPFLAWIARFRGRIGREKVPTVAELYSAPLAQVQLNVTAAGVTALALGVALGVVALTYAGAAAFAAGAVLLAAQMIRVMTVEQRAEGRDEGGGAAAARAMAPGATSQAGRGG